MGVWDCLAHFSVCLVCTVQVAGVRRVYNIQAGWLREGDLFGPAKFHVLVSVYINT